ncbi:MAG: hypothetical protein Q9217_005974 [Psora testacea]
MMYLSQGLLLDRCAGAVQSWLLPSNRKLRHLQGLSFRNLALAKPTNLPRGKTIDDEPLPNALKAPAKALSQRENQKLEHSRSSSDLKQTSQAKSAQESADPNRSLFESSRPSGIKLRRRSTLNWMNASPRIRQQKLEDVITDRMADTWFSLHSDGLEEPIYVSEVVEKAMNPSFRFFDLNAYGPFVSRRDEVTVKYWAKTPKMDEYILLIELRVNLRLLQFIGKTLESFHYPLPPNTILFHLSDGLYTSFTDLPIEETINTTAATKKMSQNLESTSSFDALMRLSNLDDCIQDALSTRQKLTSQINDILQAQKVSRDAINAASQAEEQLATTNRSLSACRRQVKAAQNRRLGMEASLASRRAAIALGLSTQQKAESRLQSIPADLSSRKRLRQNTKSDVSGQTRRIGEDLSIIYPIEPLSPGSLSFTIRSLHLPYAGSAFNNHDPSITAAALGHTSHATRLLSYYLSTPLPYPPTPHGSTSTIYDPISTSMPSEAARTFPLYQKGALAYRFDYGVFLLNSDIELLMIRQGARMVDLRHTLGNLKYLLTVITEGEGELPSRKKGLVKALNGRVKGESRDSSVSVKAIEKASRTNGKIDLSGTRRILGDGERDESA